MPPYSNLPLGSEGTIYEKEKGFDDSLKIEIDPKKTKFIKELKKSEASSIFHVYYDGKPRVLKVVCGPLSSLSYTCCFLSDQHLVPHQ